MLTTLLAVAVAFGLSTSIDDTATPPPSPSEHVAVTPVRVLYCTHSAGFRHPVLPHSRDVVTKLAGANDWLTVTVTDEVSGFSAATFASIDVLMLYTSGTLPLDDTQRDALVRFLEDGGAIVGIHSATDTFHDWPWFVAAIGGTFDGHPWHESVTVRIDDPDHPSTRHLVQSTVDAGGAGDAAGAGGDGAKDGVPAGSGTPEPSGAGVPSFEIRDEIYQFKSLNPKRHTLLSLDTSKVTHSVEEGRAYPLAWTLEVGKGRVFYTAFGHDQAVWDDERFRQHLLGGIRWAADATRPAGSTD